MSPVSGVGNPPPAQPPSDKGHGNHGASPTAIPASNPGQSFAATLAQAMGQTTAGSPPHANHSAGISGSSIPTNTASHSQGHGAAARSPIGGGQSGHGEHGFQELALRLRAYRQQLIATNIANADTPGYKAVDIDFQEALRIAQSASQAPLITPTMTSAAHILGKAFAGQPPFPLKYHTPSQASVDGNTVELDVERAKFAENAMMYEFALDRVKGHYMHMTEMLKNLKD